MQIICQGEGKDITLALRGDLDQHAARQAIREIGLAIDTRLPLGCVMDLSGVDFMDSSGIAVVLGVYRRMKELGGTLNVERVPPQAWRVFRAAGVDKLVPVRCADKADVRA
jgi:stage II sporulation protein AA (anti-sigma F factor antagonist)